MEGPRNNLVQRPNEGWHEERSEHVRIFEGAGSAVELGEQLFGGRKQVEITHERGGGGDHCRPLVGIQDQARVRLRLLDDECRKHERGQVQVNRNHGMDGRTPHIEGSD